jgi:hypothetical protein
MSISLLRTKSLLHKYAAEKPYLLRKALTQLEGFYAKEPKYLKSGTVGGGLPYKTLRQIAKSSVKNPITTMKTNWLAMGPKRELLLKTKAKHLPRLAWGSKALKPSAFAPSVQRAFFIAQALEAGRKATRAPKGQRAKQYGRLVGGSLGWLAGSRARLLPSLALWSAGQGLGSLTGSAIAKMKKGA